jgi:hypothetical protein
MRQRKPLIPLAHNRAMTELCMNSAAQATQDRVGIRIFRTRGGVEASHPFFAAVPTKISFTVSAANKISNFRNLIISEDS